MNFFTFSLTILSISQHPKPVLIYFFTVMISFLIFLNFSCHSSSILESLAQKSSELLPCLLLDSSSWLETAELFVLRLGVVWAFSRSLMRTQLFLAKLLNFWSLSERSFKSAYETPKLYLKSLLNSFFQAELAIVKLPLWLLLEPKEVRFVALDVC